MTEKQPNPIDVAVGTRLKMERKIRRISQTQLAQHLGVTFQQVQKYEKGMNRISASRMMMIADFFGFSPATLFEAAAPQGAGAHNRSSSAREKSDITEFATSLEGLALNQAFLKIQDPQLRHHIVGLVKAAAKSDNGSEDASSIGDAKSIKMLG